MAMAPSRVNGLIGDNKTHFDHAVAVDGAVAVSCKWCLMGNYSPIMPTHPTGDEHFVPHQIRISFLFQLSNYRLGSG